MQYKLSEFANGLKTGYIKPWKAFSIVNTLTRMPEMLRDHERLLAYVRNCLEMESFNTADCEKVAEFLKENM